MNNFIKLTDRTFFQTDRLFGVMNYVLKPWNN